MKRIMKFIGITLIVLIISGILIVKLLPSIFWWAHGEATKKLQVQLIEGRTDLEYAYGQDLLREVSVMTTEEGYTIFYPGTLNDGNAADLAVPESGTERYPIVVWGNGTGNTYVNYEPALKSLASYGFVVVGCDNSNMGDGQLLYDMALYMKALQDDPNSLFFGRLDTDKIGSAGHSQGACGAVNAATKYEDSAELFASLFTTSLPKLSMCVDQKGMEFAYWRYDISRISVPYFANTGTRFLDSMWISPLSSMQENFADLQDGLEAYGARQIGANHNIVNEYHGCGYLNAWFCYTLKGDMQAAQIFIGDDPEILRNTGRWTDFLRNEVR